MEQNFLDNRTVDNKFLDIATRHLSQIEASNSEIDLKKISFSKLYVLMQSLHEYRPKSHIRQEKRDFITYLKFFISKSIKEYSSKELLELKAGYLLNITGNKLRKNGYTTKGGWIGGLLFTLPIDILLWIFVGNYYYYIPIISLPFMVVQYNKELKAKKEKKLW